MSNLDFMDIKELDKLAMNKAKVRIDGLIKPLGSLGLLEDMAIRLSGITGEVYNEINKKAVVVMCSDNGVCSEGVASSPKVVTMMQTINFLKGFTGIGVLSDHCSSDVKVVDIGVDGDLHLDGIISRKIRRGTSNIALGEAMTRDEAIDAIKVGFNLIGELKNQGYNLIGTGEMGIGNTTTSSAILMALTGEGEDLAVGRGAGLTDEQLDLKKAVIKKAIEINNPKNDDPIDVLHKLGGFDIAGLVGLYLGAAHHRVPIVIDGFISIVAALVAYKINPLAKEFMFPSHISKEPGYKIAIDSLELKPILALDMRLGEGVGCPLAFNIIEASTKIVKNMATFEEGQVSIENYKDLWEKEA